jgi:uncharacterized Tic20 family protein
MKPVPTSDERFLAALAHATVWFFVFGTIGALAIWITQRKKSAYVAFHSLQALLYQALEAVVVLLVSLVFATFNSILVIVMTIFLAKTGHDYSPFIVFYIYFSIFIIFVGLFVFYALGGLVAAGLCLAGREPHYPWLGNWLAKYLGRDPERMEERQERVVASACHLTAFIPIWGIALPVVAWFSQRKHSAVLRFQGLQAMIYQLISLVFIILLQIVSLVMGFFFFLVILVSLPGSNPTNNTIAFILIIIPMLVMFFLETLALLLGPLYQTFALIAAWQVSHDRDYRYPLLGKWVANRLNI